MNYPLSITEKQNSYLPFILLFGTAIPMFLFYSTLTGTLNQIGIPLTFSHHILEYHFFFKRGFGFCHPLTSQGRALIRKEHLFYLALLVFNLSIALIYYQDRPWSERMYNSIVFFHILVAIFYFISYFKYKPLLNNKWLILALFSLGISLWVYFFLDNYDEFSEIVLNFCLDLHLLIWFIIFYFDLKKTGVSIASILIILSFWVLWFSEIGYYLDLLWVFFSFNHIAFESYVVVKGVR